MSTYRELVFMCQDELKNVSDDTDLTNEHIIFLLEKYKALLFRQIYGKRDKVVPKQYYSELCLDLEVVDAYGGECMGKRLRTVSEIPAIMNEATPMVYPVDFMVGELNYVEPEQLKTCGTDKWTKNLIYCAIGPDQKLYFKSGNIKHLYLKKIRMYAVFEDFSKANELACSTQSEESCDILDKTFAIEEAQIPILIQYVVRDASGILYRPKDTENNDYDDFNHANNTKAQQPIANEQNNQQ